MPFARKHLEHPVAHYLAWLGVSLFATFLMDAWGCILHIVLNKPWPSYALVGRYFLAAFAKGHLYIAQIATLPSYPHEQLVGWLIHICIGLVDTVIYMTIIFKILKTTPHLLTSLLIAWSLMFMPMFIEQPMLGMGIAAHLTNNPDAVRLTTFSYHTVFGLGLFYGSVIFHRIFVLMTHLKKKK